MAHLKWIPNDSVSQNLHTTDLRRGIYFLFYVVWGKLKVLLKTLKGNVLLPLAPPDCGTTWLLISKASKVTNIQAWPQHRLFPPKNISPAVMCQTWHLKHNNSCTTLHAQWHRLNLHNTTNSQFPEFNLKKKKKHFIRLFDWFCHDLNGRVQQRAGNR